MIPARPIECIGEMTRLVAELTHVLLHGGGRVCLCRRSGDEGTKDITQLTIAGLMAEAAPERIHGCRIERTSFELASLSKFVQQLVRGGS